MLFLKGLVNIMKDKLNNPLSINQEVVFKTGSDHLKGTIINQINDDYVEVWVKHDFSGFQQKTNAGIYKVCTQNILSVCIDVESYYKFILN